MRGIWALSFLAMAGVAHAQEDPYECDDRYAPCGTPEQTGGGGGGGGSILVNNTDLGETYQNADDYDDDGIEDPYDNCPWVANPEQLDDDGDTVGTACDSCPVDINPDQLDLDGDLLGDLCDPDLDGDGVEDSVDLCVDRPDPLQRDRDGDGLGDACDDDLDGDGIPNLEDNCVYVPNPDQADASGGDFGDACEEDEDGDGIRDLLDNCSFLANTDQADLDADGIGDACDADVDNDGLVNAEDNCMGLPNADQLDSDRDRLGDACDERFCYVVYDAVDQCLDPSQPLSLYLMGGEVQEDSPVRLRLFANHEDQRLEYKYVVASAPPGSRATVEHAVGFVNESSPYEYRYQDGQEAVFTPDRPGEYIIRVVATLDGTDPVTGMSNPSADTEMALYVAPAAKGCATVGGTGAWVLAALPLLAFRRKKED